MSDDYAELRAALTAGPTPGPWYHCQPKKTVGPTRTVHGTVPKTRVDFVSVDPKPVHRRIVVPMQCECSAGVRSVDMQYIAASNPDEVAKLLAERDRLRAEVEELRRDAERWRWWRDHLGQITVETEYVFDRADDGAVSCASRTVRTIWLDDDRGQIDRESIVRAVDVAMKPTE